MPNFLEKPHFFLKGGGPPPAGGGRRGRGGGRRAALWKFFFSPPILQKGPFNGKREKAGFYFYGGGFLRAGEIWQKNFFFFSFWVKRGFGEKGVGFCGGGGETCSFFLKFFYSHVTWGRHFWGFNLNCRPFKRKKSGGKIPGDFLGLFVVVF